MAIHVRCSTLKFSQFSYLRTLATRKQTNSTQADKTLNNALIVQSENRKTALAKHLNRSLALTAYKQDETRICPRDNIITSIYPVTNSVKSLIPLDGIFSLIGGFTSNHGNKLLDIEHFIGLKDIAKPVALSSDDIILIQDNETRGRFMNDLEVINEIIQKERPRSDFKGSSTKHTKHILSEPKTASKHQTVSEPKTVLGDQFTLHLCNTLNCQSQRDTGNTPDKNQEPADSPETKLLEMKLLLEKKLLRSHFVKHPKFYQFYGDFSPHVVFENHFFKKPVVAKQIHKYVAQMVKMQFWCSSRYVQTQFKILRSSAHHEDRSIRIRWRLSCLGFFAALTVQIRHITGRKINVEEYQHHYDCYSIFHVNDEGKIVKHRLDRVILDEESKATKRKNFLRRFVASFGVALGK